MTDRLVIRIEPSEEMNDLLRASTVVGGVSIMECRWWEQGKCLAIFQMREREGVLFPNEWYVRKALTGAGGWPRQPDRGDIEEMRQMLNEAANRPNSRNSAANWYKENVTDPNAESERKSWEQFHDDQDQIKKQYDMERRNMCWHGIRKDVDCPTCRMGQRMAEDARRTERRHRARFG